MIALRLTSRCLRTSLGAGLLLLLAACASSPPAVQHYTLPQLDRSYPVLPAAVSPVTLQLSAVHVADHIDRHGLLYQRSDITLSEASQHVWAESIRAQLGRGLRLELSTRLQPLQVLDARQMLPGDPRDYQLSIQVEQFQGHHAGRAIVAGTWTLRDASGELIVTQPYRIERPLAENGYPALVRSLDAAWLALAADISRSLLQRDARLQPHP